MYCAPTVHARVPWGSRYLRFLLALAVLLMAAPAFAQDAAPKPVTPSAKQSKLNESGVRALANGDYVTAISLLEESVYIGKLNIAYLNLGRAYELAGKCDKARETLEKVAGATPVVEPPVGFVNSKAKEYLAELDTKCKTKDKTATTAQATPKTTVQPDKSGSSVAAPATPADAGSATKTWGIATTSVGAALVVGAVGMHFLWAESIRQDARDSANSGTVVHGISQRDFLAAQDDANTVDTAALATGIVGGISTGVGVYLWLSDDGDAQQSLLMTPTTGGTELTYSARF